MQAILATRRRGQYKQLIFKRINFCFYNYYVILSSILMGKSCESKKKNIKPCVQQDNVYFGGVLKNSLPNKPANWYFTHGPVGVAVTFCRCGIHAPLAMYLADVQKPLSLVFLYFVFLFFYYYYLTTALFTCDDSFRTRLDFKLTCSFLFFNFFFTRTNRTKIILRSIIYCFKLLHMLLLNGI